MADQRARRPLDLWREDIAPPRRQAGRRRIGDLGFDARFGPGAEAVSAARVLRPAVLVTSSGHDASAGAAPAGDRSVLTHCVQIAYVTNDLDRAKALFQADYGVRRWLDLGAAAGRTSIVIQARDGARIEIRAAIAYGGTTQFELIQPLDDPEGLYTDVLRGERAFAIRLHHLGLRQDSAQAVRALEGRLKVTNAIPLATESQLTPVFDADARDRLGHYLEYFSLPADFDDRIPRN